VCERERVLKTRRTKVKESDERASLGLKSRDYCSKRGEQSWPRRLVGLELGREKERERERERERLAWN